jgi:large subunit ribosomal protein L33
MAGKKKVGQMLIKLVSQAGTGYFYVTRKNPRNVPYKLQRIKYDPRVNKHVLFTEAKLK